MGVRQPAVVRFQDADEGDQDRGRRRKRVAQRNCERYLNSTEVFALISPSAHRPLSDRLMRVTMPSHARSSRAG
jgi:hypothetical protein